MNLGTSVFYCVRLLVRHDSGDGKLVLLTVNKVKGTSSQLSKIAAETATRRAAEAEAAQDGGPDVAAAPLPKPAHKQPPLTKHTKWPSSEKELAIEVMAQQGGSSKRAVVVLQDLYYKVYCKLDESTLR